MPTTLVINGHRNPNDSIFGRALFLAASALPQVTTHTLITTYPDFKINGANERELLSKHNNIVLQFPFYWYSCPAIVKEWLDETLSRGWAYGGGQALAGKKLLVAVTTGGPEKVYQHEGTNSFTVEEFLRPFLQTANLCGMQWKEPFVMYGVRYLDDDSIANYCANYQDRIVALD